MKALLLIVLVFCLSLFTQGQTNPEIPNVQIETRHDRFSDLTLVTVTATIRRTTGLVDLGGGSVYAQPGAVPEFTNLSITGTVEGKDITRTVPQVTFTITSLSGEWKYLSSPLLLQIISTKGGVPHRATLGEMKRSVGDVLRNGRGVMEQLTLVVPFSAAEVLALSDKVEMRVGAEEFQLTPVQLQDIAEWTRKFPAARNKAETTNTPTDSQPVISNAPGTDVKVKGYYRKDGTYVRPHTRSAPRKRKNAHAQESFFLFSLLGISKSKAEAGNIPLSLRIQNRLRAYQFCIDSRSQITPNH